MDQFVQAVSELITDHWVKFVTAIAFGAVGWLIAHTRANRAWKRREFFNRINFSLNTIREETLRIRTLAEKTCSDVFLNDVATQMLIRTAQKTTAENALIPVSKDDSWYFLNAVLNEISEQFAVGLIAQEAGQSVTSVSYLICLTNECDGEIRTRKIRAMVIRRDLLQNLPKDSPKFEQTYHKRRWTTLQQLSAAYQKEPWRFLEVELVS